MPKYLLIIESPGKLKKIKSFLGKDYEVVSTKGHIKELPAKGLNVNIKKDFEPTYDVMLDKRDVVKNIKNKAKKVDMVYIATDLDREGEKMAVDISDILPANKEYKRIVYNSVTRNALLQSIENAGEIDENLVNSYECRRILDRICGYKVSYLTKQATGGISAGRVQSATLRILAEREKEIQSFIPITYFVIEAELERKNGERVKSTIKVPKPLDIRSREKAEEICETLKNKPIKVKKYEVKEVSTKAYPPFTTSTLYQSGSAILGWGSGKTAQVSQKLYEDGLITYIRTDSTSIVPEFISEIKSEIDTKYGSNYLPEKENSFINRKNAQEAHEAIRITQIGSRSLSVAENRRLYEIIGKRTIASQMAHMRQKKGSAEFECEEYILSTNGSKVIFDGWRKCWNYGDLEDSELPEFEVGEILKLIKVKIEEKETQPPPRFTEASIVKELEKNGIGRPSTYAAIVKTLLNRDYIEKQKKTIHTTDMGIKVSDFLVASDFCFIDINFTQSLESDLDDIAKNEKNKVCVLRNFWERLKSDIENAKVKKNELNTTDYKCPKCGGNLLIKHGRFGDFLSCENYSKKDDKCDYKCGINKETGEPVEREEQETKYSDFECPNCNSKLVEKTSKKGWEYLACESWNKDKKCQGFYDKETGDKVEFKKRSKK